MTEENEEMEMKSMKNMKEQKKWNESIIEKSKIIMKSENKMNRNEENIYQSWKTHEREERRIK